MQNCKRLLELIICAPAKCNSGAETRHISDQSIFFIFKLDLANIVFKIDAEYGCNVRMSEKLGYLIKEYGGVKEDTEREA